MKITTNDANEDNEEVFETMTPALVPAFQSTRKIRKLRQTDRPNHEAEDDEEKKVKESRSLVSMMLGEAEEDGPDGRREHILIPKNAEAVEVETEGDKTRLTSPEEKAKRDTQKTKNYPEPLMTPALALVAPDVTPEAMRPIHPAEVPDPLAAFTQPGVPSRPAQPTTTFPKPQNPTQADIMNMFLQNAPKPEASSSQVQAVESVQPTLPTGIPSPAIYAGLEGGTVSAASIVDCQASTPPVQNDIKGIMEVMRRHVKR